LIIDLERCERCPECVAHCGWGAEAAVGASLAREAFVPERSSGSIEERNAPEGIREQGSLLQGHREQGLLLQGHREQGLLLQGHCEQGSLLQGLREKVVFALLCRRCEVASCVIACPFDAIERQEDGIIRRYNLRCVSCKSCAHACPFGTIYPEMLTFYDRPYESFCEQCLAGSDDEPACVASCGQGALEYRVADPDEGDLHILDDYVAARVRKWVKREAGLEPGGEAHP
jgi:Fe-S-cluster-containing dehydrogenase component